MPRSSDLIQDELLVLSAQAGDTAAFEALLRRWLPVMRRHAARLTGDPAAAEDVSQDACLALVAGLPRLADPAMARPWMLRIVTHKAADWIRRRQRDRHLAQTLQNRQPRTPSHDSESAPASESPAAAIHAACRALPIDLRALVSLYYGEALPIAVIAAAVDAPAGTVKSRLHDARTQLKALLERTHS
jgi:RNA polymerase sigma-70 factor, ECF subfamily